ncbi:hypothetical protein PfdVgp6 [Periplaneta fuliginosa densovirus]|uniref:Uncharacterized protein n=2 Tax=Pefuambidensovirus blattodean1 TaxID=3052603 RepID=Q77NU7_PFDNG|nr:hypothetical protein PfdVgp6 [Periplaneta fuliginosa densovirus]AAF04299.1 unknown [Periplaneta fuliginosa densovirus]BAA82962.1 nonstructural protein [Periplaneta fuliginosa densovirus]
MESSQTTVTMSQLWMTLWERYGNECVTMPGFWMRLLETDLEDSSQEEWKTAFLPMVRYWARSNNFNVTSYQELKERLSDLFAGTLATSWPATTQEKLIESLDKLLEQLEITQEICALYQPTTIMSTSSMTARIPMAAVDAKSSKKRQLKLSVAERLENVKRLAQSHQISGTISSSISFPTDGGFSSLKWEGPWSDYRMDIKLYRSEDIKDKTPDKYWEHALLRAQVNYAENHPLKKLLEKVQELIVEMAEGEDDVQVTSAKKWRK